MFNGKVFLAEFIGTFALTFVGIAAGVIGGASNSLGISVLVTALAGGFVLAVMIYTYGEVSGAHVNPAVTFGLALNGTIKWGQAAFYWIAQFVGAILAGFALSYTLQALGGTIDGGATTGVLTNAASATTQTYVMAMVMEAILTFFLVNTFLHSSKIGSLGGLAVGATYAFGILAGGAFTGGSFNPARTFGALLPLAVSKADFSAFATPFTYVVYLFGPLVGATIAVLAFNYFQGITEEEIVEIEEVEVVEIDEAAS